MFRTQQKCNKIKFIIEELIISIQLTKIIQCFSFKLHQTIEKFRKFVNMSLTMNRSKIKLTIEKNVTTMPDLKSGKKLNTFMESLLSQIYQHNRAMNLIEIRTAMLNKTQKSVKFCPTCSRNVALRLGTFRTNLIIILLGAS